jgi:hypothetical protein
MSFKFKAAFAAASLALVSASASAANWAPSTTPGTGGDLFVIVYDTLNKDAYVKDLGLTFSEFAAAGNTAGFSLNYDLGADTNYQSFATAAGSDSLSYYIAGASTAVNGAGQMMFSGLHAPTGTFSGANGTAMASAINNWMTKPAVAAAMAAGSGSFFTTPADAFDPLNTNQFNQFWINGLSSSNSSAAAVNTALNFYQANRVGNGPMPVSQFAGTWDLTSQGGQVGLTYAVAAVPEPGTWALMAAGLLFVAGMARRRSSV